MTRKTQIRCRSSVIHAFMAFMSFALLAAVSAPALAGSMPLAWDAVTDSDLAGYKIYYGTSSGSYSQSLSVGKVTSYTLSGLTDCTKYYVAIKAVDTSGNESASYSTEMTGLSTPVVSSLSPASGEEGQSLTVTVTGTNFDSGASVKFVNTSVTSASTSYVSCTELRASVTIPLAASTGSKDIEVVNSDLSFGAKSAAFQVAANIPPTVGVQSPADGANSIGITVRPNVTFSEAMDPASITSSTVKLLKPDGSAVAQASGSPILDVSGKVVTITPASNLVFQTVYKIQVTGGSGVRDTSGASMTSTFTQSQGFTTAAAPDTQPPTVASTSPADGATGVALNTTVSVTFSEAIDPLSVTSSSMLLLKPDGTPVAQASGSPALDTAHLVVTITLAAPLAENTTYRIRVTGGSSGVKDAAGNALASTFTQGTGFTTRGVPPGNVQNLHRSDTH